jgi:hypothetical protein
VRQFAEQNGYTLVLKIDREFEASTSYKTIQQTLSQMVMRHSASDDITDAVINYLNKQYEAAGESAARPPVSRDRPSRDRSSGDGTSDSGDSDRSSRRTPPNPPSRRSSAR